MDMFCFQCQEALNNTGCVKKGVCGKTSELSARMDLLIYLVKGLAWYSSQCRKMGVTDPETDHFICDALFSTITNANFDEDAITMRIRFCLDLRNKMEEKYRRAGGKVDRDIPPQATWGGETEKEFEAKSREVGVLTTEDEDIRSLRELVVYGLKGMAAYTHHAMMLDCRDDDIHDFMQRALATVISDAPDTGELTRLVLETGRFGIRAMKLLDAAHNDRYGAPEMSRVKTGVGGRPGILVSGHDLRDLEELLEQTGGKGVDVYTHSEMLPAHYYPAFKKYSHFIGNYGNSWWAQRKEFESFHGPVLFTTNCIVPPLKSAGYGGRIYTTGSAGLPGAVHIPERKGNKPKDFSRIIEHAGKCDPPGEIEDGIITGGFAHRQIMKFSDEIVGGIRSGDIKKFVVMAGCDGRMKSRQYYTDFAGALPGDTLILTAGCAKYRYNKLPLGDINGIPRVLDAGQCNDSYSLVVVAQQLKEVFKLEDINELPVAYNIAWYEQKAVIVLLALLSLGIRNIHLGPTLPAFLSENVGKVLQEKFGLTAPETVDEDMKELLG